MHEFVHIGEAVVRWSTKQESGELFSERLKITTNFIMTQFSTNSPREFQTATKSTLDVRQFS